MKDIEIVYKPVIPYFFGVTSLGRIVLEEQKIRKLTDKKKGRVLLYYIRVPIPIVRNTGLKKVVSEGREVRVVIEWEDEWE